MNAFVKGQRVSQGGYFGRNHPEQSGYLGANYRLDPKKFVLNLAPEIREAAPAYFKEKGISWHTHCGHGLSSQICCLNFLMPLAHRPKLLSRLIGHALGIDPPDMLPMEHDTAGRAWFVAFEWIGGDHLNEAAQNGTRTRGTNATSADAVVRFQHNGQTEILLIEWKYTESYGAPIPPAGNPTRMGRYRDIAFAPNGPIRADLGLAVEDFFWEPFYQLLRQQMLAFQMEMAREDGATRVRVLHISPAGNRALHKVTAPALRRFGTDAFEAFRAVLAQRGAFVGATIESLFQPLFDSGEADADEWSAYIRDRYDLAAGWIASHPDKAAAAAGPSRSVPVSAAHVPADSGVANL